MHSTLCKCTCVTRRHFSLITHTTSKCALTTKSLLLFYQTALTECLITHFPGITALTNIYGMMNFKNAMLNGLLITRLTFIRSHTTMYVLMIYQTALFTECLHNCTIAHHYVCADALSDFSFYWMPYYTLDKCNGTHCYVWVDVLSDCSLSWMPCYTHHKNKDAHCYVHVGGFSDFSGV